MEKIILVLFLISIHCSSNAQSSTKFATENRIEVEKIIAENKKEEKTVRDPYYKIKITTYGKDLIEYNRVYENYYHFNYRYLVKNDFISYFHEKGQSGKVHSGKINEKLSYADLFEAEYFFIDKNKGYKYEKKVPLYKGDNIIEKQIEFDKLEYTITEIGNSEYNSIYKFYSVYVKK